MRHLASLLCLLPLASAGDDTFAVYVLEASGGG